MTERASVKAALVVMAVGLASCGGPMKDGWPVVGDLCGEVGWPSDLPSPYVGARGPRTAVRANSSLPLLGPNDLWSVWICEADGRCWPVMHNDENARPDARWQTDGSLLVATRSDVARAYPKPKETLGGVPPPPVRIVSGAQGAALIEAGLPGVGGETFDDQGFCKAPRDFQPR